VLVLCPNCNSALPDWLLRTSPIDTLCPACYKPLIIEFFPALFRPAETIDTIGLAAAEGEATCFEHPAKRAVGVCSHCGRFLCALCEVSVRGEIWCPACIASGPLKPKLQTLETHRTLYDSIALALSTLPMLLIYPVVLTAPVSLFVAIRYWNRPSSLIPRSKWRLVLTIVFALAQLAMVGSIIYALIAARPRMK